MFGIKRRFQRCKAWAPRFKESSVRVHQIWVPPWKVRFLLLSTNLAREWLQIDTDFLRIITSTADELSVGTNIDDLEWPWIPKKGVLVNFVLSTDTQQLHITFLIMRWRHCAIATVHYGWHTNLLHISSMAIAQHFKKAEALYFIQQEIWANAHETHHSISLFLYGCCLGS